MAVAHRRGPSLQFKETGAGSFDVDSFLARRFKAELTEAGDGALRSTAMTGSERIIKRSLSLAAPHQSVNVIRSQVIFDQTQPEIAHVRIPRTRACRRLPVHVKLHSFIKARHVAPEHIL